MAFLQQTMFHGKLHKNKLSRFAMDWIATFDFEANELDFLIKLFSNNRYERFKQDYCEPVHRAYSTARFHLEFFRCAAMYGTAVEEFSG
ncbi:hypothetical protein NSQ41_11870 [Aeribacillus sp. FSL K6-8210]|uniref:hypothetical protein n=2 Tax=unclassified Aeribacillus TaxID=2640495 RepID=UPI0030D098F2